LGDNFGSALPERLGLRYVERGLDLDIQIAVQDGNRANADVLTAHNCAGPLVDDHTRGPIRFNREIFQLCEKFNGAGGILSRNGLTKPAFSACAAGLWPLENFLLIASIMRAEVVKSASCNWRRTTDFGAIDGAARSTVAPFGPRPTVG
jgi:hypothetical protein